MCSHIPLKFMYYVMVKVFMKLMFFVIMGICPFPKANVFLQYKNKSVENFFHLVEKNEPNGQQTKINDLVTVFEEILYFFGAKNPFCPFPKVFMKLHCFDIF